MELLFSDMKLFQNDTLLLLTITWDRGTDSGLINDSDGILNFSQLSTPYSYDDELLISKEFIREFFSMTFFVRSFVKWHIKWPLCQLRQYAQVIAIK
jgi:hypothetical protein